MKNIVCFVVVVALLAHVASARFAAVGKSTAWYWSNAACLGDPDTEDSWNPIDPVSHNCSIVTLAGDAIPYYVSSEIACPSTPGSSWTVSSYQSANCLQSDMIGGSTYTTGQCIAYDSRALKRGASDRSYFVSCQGDPQPAFPYVYVQEVDTCLPQEQQAKRGLNNAAGMSNAIFANTPGVCVPYFNNSDNARGFQVYSTYAKLNEICNPAAPTQTLAVQFYNDSSCTHLQQTVPFSSGCAQFPGAPNPFAISCVPPETTPSVPGSPSTPTGSASPLSVSFALISLLAATVAAIMF